MKMNGQKVCVFLQKTYTDVELLPIPNNLNNVDNNIIHYFI